MISAQEAYDKLVLTADNRKLGRCKNVIMNRNTKHADLFIIPESILNNSGTGRLFRNQKGAFVGTAGNIGGEQTAHRALGVIPQQVHHIIEEGSLDFVSNIPAGFLGSLLGGWIQRTIKSIEESYYLIPISHVTEIHEDVIEVSIDLALSRKWYLNVKITSDHKPFFPFDQHLLSRLQIIGLSSLQKPIIDEKPEKSDNKAIKDLEIDSFDDVASIILRNIDKLAGH